MFVDFLNDFKRLNEQFEQRINMKALLYKINGNNCDFRHGKYDSCCTVQRFRLGFVGKYRSCSRPYQRGYHAEQYFLIFGIPLIAKSDTEPVRAVKVIINTLVSTAVLSRSR